MDFDFKKKDREREREREKIDLGAHSIFSTLEWFTVSMAEQELKSSHTSPLSLAPLRNSQGFFDCQVINITYVVPNVRTFKRSK